MDFDIKCVCTKYNGEQVEIKEGDIIKIQSKKEIMIGKVNCIDHIEYGSISVVTDTKKYVEIFFSDIKDISKIENKEVM